MVPPLVRLYLTIKTSQRYKTLFAVSGEPVLPYCMFRKATPGGIWAVFLIALHQPATLCEKRNRLLHPIVVLPTHPNKKCILCQARSISSALLSVVSVMVVPPMILASSCFRPSKSSGVTVVYVLPCRSSFAISRWVSAKAAS